MVLKDVWFNVKVSSFEVAKYHTILHTNLSIVNVEW